MVSDAQTRRASRREQEAMQRRHEILQAARTLFIQKGFRDTTLDEIAEKAAFGKGTIYNYFPSKEDLFHTFMQELVEEILTQTRKAMSVAPDNARDRLLAYAETMLSQFHRHDDVVLMLLREHHQLDPKTVEQFSERMQEKLAILMEPLTADMQAGRIRSADASTMAALFDGMVSTYCIMTARGLWPGNARTSHQVAELLVSMFFDGIANKPL